MLTLALVSMNLMPYSSAINSPSFLLMTRESDKSHLLPIIKTSTSEDSSYKKHSVTLVDMTKEVEWMENGLASGLA